MKLLFCFFPYFRKSNVYCLCFANALNFLFQNIVQAVLRVGHIVNLVHTRWKISRTFWNCVFPYFQIGNICKICFNFIINPFFLFFFLQINAIVDFPIKVQSKRGFFYFGLYGQIMTLTIRYTWISYILIVTNRNITVILCC